MDRNPAAEFRSQPSFGFPLYFAAQVPNSVDQGTILWNFFVGCERQQQTFEKARGKAGEGYYGGKRIDEAPEIVHLRASG
jgi:hypothetical protein